MSPDPRWRDSPLFGGRARRGREFFPGRAQSSESFLGAPTRRQSACDHSGPICPLTAWRRGRVLQAFRLGVGNMAQLPGGPMVRRHVLVTGATSGIGKATALGLARLGARVSIVGRDPRRTEAAADEIRAAGRRRVSVFLADLSSQAQVRRLADQVLARHATDRRARQQRRRVLEHPARHRRRARTHLRPQPSRAVPAHQPVARPADGERTGPGGHGVLPGPGQRADRLRRPARANRTTPAHARTASRSSPTSCSPTSSRGTCRARR